MKKEVVAPIRYDMGEQTMRDWLERYEVPEHLRETLMRYVLDGIQMGRGLTAVVENDLFTFVSYADTQTLQSLHLLVKFFYNVTPGPCWGSPTKVSLWMRQGGMNGRDRESAR
jgi:hypothetical protein